MVDVSSKPVTARQARAIANVVMSAAAFKAAEAGELPKGALLEVVRLAGVMAAKRTHELVPSATRSGSPTSMLTPSLTPSFPGCGSRARFAAPTGPGPRWRR